MSAKQYLHVAVVGGGINGVMTAWSLARRGHEVALYERATLMGATSSASSKLLHGGLRYLEQGDVRLVREGLHERAWWLAHAPHLCRPLELTLPVYVDSPHGRSILGIGLTMYDALAGKATLGRHHWYSVDHLPAPAMTLRRDGLRGVFTYVDAMMADDRALGLWAADQARRAGVVLHEQAPVEWIAPDGTIRVAGRDERFDAVVNAAGPWARELLDTSGISTDTRLDLVRGSHLVVERPAAGAFALELPTDERLVFALPYEGRTLVGTTEVRQTLDEPIECSEDERDYLIAAYNAFFTEPITPSDVHSTFAGVRPLVHAGRTAHAQRRGERVETNGRVVSVFGGKWTGARALGERVARRVERATS
jgi:glycerol-3-phosphate dehydrogenase